MHAKTFLFFLPNFFHQQSGKGLGIITSAMYVRRHFSAESKRQVEEMAGKVRAALAERIDSAGWMDRGTKEVARAKLREMRQTIGYPDEMLDEAEVATVHRGLELVQGDFFRSVLAINR